MKDVDEPVESEIPDFEARLSSAIKKAVTENVTGRDKKHRIDLSRFTWTHVARKIIKEPF